MESPVRVLVVDDPEAGSPLADALDQGDHGLEVLTADGVAEGLDRLDAADVDGVVSAGHLPDGEGLELLEAVREVHPDLPFVLCAGSGDDGAASRAADLAATAFVPRDGTSEEELARRVRAAVSGAAGDGPAWRTEAWFSRLLEHASDFLFVVDETGAVSYVSPSVERALGYEPEDIIGESAFEFTHPDDVELAAEAFQETLEQPRNEVNVEFRATHADGSVRWLDVRGRNLLDDPVVQGVIVNARDVTERKHHELELERQDERLSNLASLLSHDLRNPLAVAMGNLELAREERDSAELATVEGALERMDELIDGVLAMTRLGETVDETEPFWLSSLAEECWSTVATADAELSVESDRVVEGDRGRLKQVVENLFRNAVEHGAAGRPSGSDGAGEHAGPDLTVRVGVLEDGFYVEDDGPGIPPDRREAVFEPGYTTADDGTGLGLNIVEAIVEAHGWTIAAVAGDDGGARFEVTGLAAQD